MTSVIDLRDYIIYDNIIDGKRNDNNYGPNEIIDILYSYLYKNQSIGFTIDGYDILSDSEITKYTDKNEKGYFLKERFYSKDNVSSNYYGYVNHVFPFYLNISILLKDGNLVNKKVLCSKVLPYFKDEKTYYKSINELLGENNFLRGYFDSFNNANKYKYSKNSYIYKNLYNFYVGFNKKELKNHYKNYLKNKKDIDFSKLSLNTKEEHLHKVYDRYHKQPEIYKLFIDLTSKSDYVIDYHINSMTGYFNILFKFDKKNYIITNSYLFNETDKEFIYYIGKTHNFLESMDILSKINYDFLKFISKLLDGRKNPLK